MVIYLMQHGAALSKDLDPDQPLSPRGRDEVQRLAHITKSALRDVSHIWPSPKTWARQIAQLLSESWGWPENLYAKEALIPLAEIDPIAQALQDNLRHCVVAGHLPFLQHPNSYLMTGTKSLSPLQFSPGTLVALEKSSGTLWSLKWMLPPDLMHPPS